MARRLEDRVAVVTGAGRWIGQALAAGCFSMAFAAALADGGRDPESLRTSARVSIERSGDGFAARTVRLSAAGNVSGIAENRFRENTAKTDESCPASRALAGPSVGLGAALATGGGSG